MANRKSIIGNNVKRLRKQHGYTQRGLAELLPDHEHGAVGAWETGRSMPPQSAIKLLAEIFDVDVDEISPPENEQAAEAISVHLTEEKFRDMLKDSVENAVGLRFENLKHDIDELKDAIKELKRELEKEKI